MHQRRPSHRNDTKEQRPASTADQLVPSLQQPLAHSLLSLIHPTGGHDLIAVVNQIVFVVHVVAVAIGNGITPAIGAAPSRLGIGLRETGILLDFLSHGSQNIRRIRDQHDHGTCTASIGGAGNRLDRLPLGDVVWRGKRCIDPTLPSWRRHQRQLEFKRIPVSVQDQWVLKHS